MPETTYIPLDGSPSRAGCLGSLSSLEKILILLSAMLAIFVLALTIALVNKGGCDTPTNVTTIQPPTTAQPTTAKPITIAPITDPTTTKEPPSSSKPKVMEPGPPEPTTTTSIQKVTQPAELTTLAASEHAGKEPDMSKKTTTERT